MKKILLILVVIISFGITANAQESKLRIAVIDLSGTGNSDSNWANAKTITSLLTTELVNTKRYRVVERSKIEQILSEQGLQASQAASAQAVELGKLLGVHKIITGEYSGIGYFHGTTSIRLIDVETGDIEAAITIKNGIYDKKGRFQRNLSYEEIAKKIVSELF